MTKENILEKYSKSPNNSLLTQELAGNSACVHLKGLVGSSSAFVATVVFQQISQPCLFILPDKETAAYFLNNLENLIGEDSVLFFPASYRMPYEYEETDNANILLRAEVLNKINNSFTLGERQGERQLCIVTYAEALTEKVVTKTHLTKNTLNLFQGEKISIEFIMDVLVNYDFERVDYVVEPGQFSIRGGIVDIFSFSNDFPYRVEFFGDEVESIRSFDAATQLSIDKLNSCTIIPNVQTKLLNESRQTFFEFIPKETIVWLNDFKVSENKIEQTFALAENCFNKLESLISRLAPQELYIHSSTFNSQIKNFRLIEFGNYFSFSSTKIIQYNFTPQPSFNKNFTFLNENLKGNIRYGFVNILFSDTSKQVERLKKIFEDISPQNENAPELFSSLLLSIQEGFIDNDLKIACYTDHQIFDRYHRFRLKNSFNNKSEALTLKELKGLNPGDYITHIDYGIGRYSGLETIEINGKTQETIRLVYKDNDVVNISIHSLHRIAKYSGKEGATPVVNKLGTNNWSILKQKTKKKVKEIAFDLIKLYAKRKALKGYQFSPDTYLQNELEASFIYEDTPDQVKATADVKRDMELETPMDRLICGDVGFGKTEVAIRAAFKAVNDSKQVAVLVPTTILALQHFKTFSERLKDMPCKVDYINRFKSTKEQKETLEKVADGKVDILIGTHGIVGKEVKFKDLGLIIIDEEQKFGVAVKDKLKTIKTNVDTLTLTATPIPRTMQFSMMGARDLSVITTPPQNRYPVQTELHTFNEEIIRDSILFEISRRGQVFFVHNRVENIKEIAGMINRLCPDARVGIGHGQLDGHELEKVMLGFVDGEFDVLVATTIIESGLDISNANTIIINQAQMFGLSDLHQMRGRVGRTNKKAFCYLLSTPISLLTTEARKRLKAIEEFSDLGSGFHIAMRDLDIRGAGNLLGGEQSGYINEIGFEMYHKILDEAIDELRIENEELIIGETINRKLDNSSISQNDSQTKKLFVSDCTIDTDLEIRLPETYVTNITERLNLYRELDDSKTEQQLHGYSLRLRDRFGAIPLETLELIDTVRLRWLAIELGLEKVFLKNSRMTVYFISNSNSAYFQTSIFSKIIKYVQNHHHQCKMKEAKSRLMITFESIKTVESAIKKLAELNS